MKKILSLVCVLIMVFMVGLSISPSANIQEDISKPLICIRGKDYNEYLQYDGYTIESSNVNFYISGRYLVKYINNATDEVVYKFVYVEDMETLKKDNCYSEQYGTLKNKNELEKVYDVLELSDGSVLYAYSQETSYIQNFKNFHLVKMNKDSTTVDITVVTGVEGIINDIIEDDGLVYVLMSVADDGFSDIALYVFDLNGTSIYSKRYEGNGIDSAIKLLCDKNYVYIIGDTTSTDGIFSFYHQYRSGVIIVLDKTIHKITHIYSVVVDSEINVVDACLVNNELYLACEYYNNTISSLLYEVHIFDNSSFTTVKKAFLSYSSGMTLNMMVSYNNTIYLVYREYDSSTKLYYTRIYKYALYEGKKKIYEYTYTKEGNAYIVDLMITEDDTIVLLYNLIKVSDTYDYGYLYQIIKGKEIICEIENYTTNCASYGLVNTNEMWVESGSSVYTNKIIYTAFSTFKEEITIEADEDIKLPIIYMDGKMVKPNYSKSNIEYNPHIFGRYEVDYYFEGVNQDVLVDGVIVVNSYTNVYEGGIFDTGLILNFNGDGNLNNYVVENEYVIKTPGSYTLKVIGKNDIETINFEVRNISYDEKIEEAVSFDCSSEVKVIVEDVKDMVINTNINKHTIPERVKDYKIWSVFIPICCMLLMASLMIKKRG